MHKRVAHALNCRLRDERLKKMLSELRSKEQSKMLRSVHCMKVIALREAIKSAERREKLSQLMQKLYRRLVKGGYQKLLRNAFMKQRLMNTLMKADRLNTLRLLRSGVEKLKAC